MDTKVAPAGGGGEVPSAAALRRDPAYLGLVAAVSEALVDTR